jgi:protein-disulfide isomerase
VKSLSLKLVVLAAATAIILGAARPETLAGQARPALGDLSASKSLGSRQAPITIEVFGDYQCPQCRAFYQGTQQQLMAGYVLTGKVYLVHRDFPLTMHPHARQAARWANAAAAAGRFEAVEKVLYARQDEWGATGQIERVLASALPPADMNRIREIFNTQTAALDAAIQRDIDLGNSRSVSGTPTVFVTHRGKSNLLPVGGVTYSLLKQYLDYLLTH